MTNHNHNNHDFDWSWLFDLIAPTPSYSGAELIFDLAWALIKFLLS